MEKPTKLYRYVGSNRVTGSLDGLNYWPNITIELQGFDIIGYTDKGYWIDLYYKKKWISATSKKKWAYPTKEAAWLNFEKRTKKHIEILQRKLSEQKEYLKLIQNGTFKD